MDGLNACWVPGTDHASIATEAKVVKKLKEKYINKHEISRSEFIDHAWDWTNKHGGIILDQLKRIDVHVIGIELNSHLMMICQNL